MADEQIVTNIVATANFSNLISDLGKVTAALANLQQTSAATNRALAAQINAINNTFEANLRKTGQFATHFVTLSSDVDTFGRRLDSGKLKLRDYFNAYRDHIRTSGGLMRDLARQQVQMQNAILQPLGTNAQGMMQYNVHVPRGLDTIKNKTALAKQELQIMNKVIQDGGIQLINWGKNTQWAGRQLSVGLTLPLVAFGRAAGQAFMQADQELTRLTKVYGGLTATSREELAKVRKDVSAVAKELAAGYGASFKDTLGLAADIAATGKQGNELLGSIKETTRLAVLGEVDRQEAMKATLALQSAFKQNTEELSESINFLNAVENQTSTTLQDLVEAIPKAGPVVEGLGGSVKDLALYLTAMREGGVNASEGANALKSALASLINPTKVATERFAGFGIDLKGIVTENAGNLTDTILALQSALDKLNPLQKQQALEQLFGKFQFSRMNALFENLGRQGSQTLQVLDLMKASSSDLANIASRELGMVTESASGKFKRAMESLKADLAGVGDQFLTVGTKLVNILDKILNFASKLPDPIKKLGALVGIFTAIAGPVIMLTGLFANFTGYLIKGYGHIKAFLKGGEGFKLLTPEILAAQKAGSLVEQTFYSDAKAAVALSAALKSLTADYIALNAAITTGKIKVNKRDGNGPGTGAGGGGGTPFIYPGGGGGRSGSSGRITDPEHSLVGPQNQRAAAHINPRDPKNPTTLFGFSIQPEPVNRVIGKTPQILSTERLPNFEGLTTIGGTSTGIVASEHARYSALLATIGMQSKAEIEGLKKTIKAGGQVSADFIATFDDILPITTRLSQNAATQSAAIVADLQAGKVTVDQARARIIQVNAQLEAAMTAEIQQFAAFRGRTIDVTKVPLVNQPLLDPRGKPNLRAMFRKGKAGKPGNIDIVNTLAEATGTKTFGGPYSIETTRPIRRNMGGSVFYNDGDQVPGPNVNADVVPAMLTPGEFVIRRDIAQQDPDGMRALNEGRAMIIPTINANRGGMIPGVQYRFGGGDILKYIAKSKLFGGFRSPGTKYWRASRNRFDYTGSNPQSFAESGIGSLVYSQARSRKSSLYKDKENIKYGITPTRPGDVLVHAFAPQYVRRLKSLGYGPEDQIPVDVLRSLGIQVPQGVQYSTLTALSTTWVKNSSQFNQKIRGAGSPAFTPDKKGWKDNWREVGWQDMQSLLGKLKDMGVPPAEAQAIAEIAASRLNTLMANNSGPMSEILFGKLVNSAEIGAMTRYSRGAMAFAANRGGRVPGYIKGGWPKRTYQIPSFKKTVNEREVLSQIDEGVRAGAYANVKPVALGPRLVDTGGKSLGVDISGAYHGKAFGARGNVHVKGYRSVGEIQNEFIGQDITREAFGLETLGGKLSIVDVQGKRVPAIVNKFDPKAAAPGQPMDFDTIIAQFLGASYRGDLDVSAGNASGNKVLDSGSNYVYNRASGPRVLTTNRPSILQMLRWLTLSEKGGAQSALIENSLDTLKQAGPAKVALATRKRIKKANSVIRKKLASGTISEENRAYWQAVLDRGVEAAGVDWEKEWASLIPASEKGLAARLAQRAKRKPKLGTNVKSRGGNIARFNRGGSVGAYNAGGRVPGVQYRGLGGGILRGLLPLIAFSAGDEISKKVGGTAGSIIQQLLFLSAFTNFGGGRSRFGRGVSAEQRLNLNPEALGQKTISPLRQSVFAGTKFAETIGIKSTGAAGKFAQVLAKVAIGATRLNFALGTITTAAQIGYGAWQNYQKGLERTRASFGLTAEAAQKLGLKVKNIGSDLSNSVKNLKLLMDTNRAIADSMTQSKAPFTMTITEYNKLTEEVKNTMQAQLDLINNTKAVDLPRLAVQLKTMFVAAGMSAEEASKKIYVLFDLSNKSSQKLAATFANADFTNIVDASTAATASIKTLNLALSKNDAQSQVNALNTAYSALSLAIENSVNEAQKKALVDKKDFNARQSQLEEESNLLDKISKTQKIEPIGEAALYLLTQANPELATIATEFDNIVSLMQKIRIQSLGFAGDLTLYNPEQTKALYDQAVGIAKDVEAQNRAGALKQQYKDLEANLNKQKQLEAAAKGERVQAQLNRRDRIKGLEEEIKKINEAADARKKALQEEQQDQDINIEIQKKRLEYQQKLAMGDMGGAAQAQLDLQKLIGSQQRTLTERAIEDKRIADIAPLQKQIDALNDAAQKISDNAALAGEGLSDLTTKIFNQKKKIQDFNDAVTAYLLNVANGTGNLNNFAAAVKAAGDKAAVAFGWVKTNLQFPQLGTGTGAPTGVPQLGGGSTAGGTTRGPITVVGPDGKPMGPQTPAVVQPNYPRIKVTPSVLGGEGSGLYYIAHTYWTDPEVVASTGYNSLTDKNGLLKLGAKFIGQDGNIYVAKNVPNDGKDDAKDGLPKEIKGLNLPTGYVLEQSKFAGGGVIKGPGTPTSDSIVTMLTGRAAGGTVGGMPIAVSTDEFITKASSVKDIGPDNMYLMNNYGASGVLAAANNLMKRKDGGILNNSMQYKNLNNSMQYKNGGIPGFYNGNIMAWRVIKGLISKVPIATKALQIAFDKLFPGRSKASDGDLPSLDHYRSSPNSDHNWGGGIDITQDPKHGVDGNKLFYSLRNDSRIKYLIWSRRIWNREIDKINSQGRHYRGANPHTRHIHISIYRSALNSRLPWLKTGSETVPSGSSSRKVTSGYGANIGAMSTSSIASPTGKFSSLRTYVVKPGDNLFDIARKNKISLANLLKVNPGIMNDPKYEKGFKIFEGTSVNIPGYKKGGLIGFNEGAGPKQLRGIGATSPAADQRRWVTGTPVPARSPITISRTKSPAEQKAADEAAKNAAEYDLKKYVEKKRKEVEEMRRLMNQPYDEHYQTPNIGIYDDAIRRNIPAWIIDKYTNGEYQDWYYKKHGQYPEIRYPEIGNTGKRTGRAYYWDTQATLEYQKYLATERMYSILKDPKYIQGVKKGYKMGGLVGFNEGAGPAKLSETIDLKNIKDLQNDQPSSSNSDIMKTIGTFAAISGIGLISLLMNRGRSPIKSIDINGMKYFYNEIDGKIGGVLRATNLRGNGYEADAFVRNPLVNGSKGMMADIAKYAAKNIPGLKWDTQSQSPDLLKFIENNPDTGIKQTGYKTINAQDKETFFKQIYSEMEFRLPKRLRMPGKSSVPKLKGPELPSPTRVGRGSVGSFAMMGGDILTHHLMRSNGGMIPGFKKGGSPKKKNTSGYDPAIDMFKQLGDLSVNFETDRSILAPDQIDELKQIAKQIQKTGIKELAVYGYADKRGSQTYNKNLSYRRANAVAALMNALLPSVKFIPAAMGEQSSDSSALEMSKQRRVSIELPPQSWGPRIAPDSPMFGGSGASGGWGGGALSKEGFQLYANGGMIPGFAGGAYVNPSYMPNMKLPSFASGVDYLRNDTIAQLHKAEAVLPADMNPFNPAAKNPIGGSTFQIVQTINAAPGMDVEQLANVATRKAVQAIKDLNSVNNSKMGPARAV